MNPRDKMMAWAQIIFSAMFFLVTFIIIILYELGFAAHLPVDQAKSFERNVDWLTGASLIVLYFWFQRARSGGIPDANPPDNTVTQKHTAPDGSTVVITSPAASTKVVAAPLATPTKESP